MLEKFLSLFERAVAALEKIAATPTGATPAAEAPAAKRGSKAATATKETPADPPAAKSEDDFLGSEPAKTYTRDDVRAALKGAQERVGADKARAVLKEVGGADTLGALKEDKFAAVVAAAEKLK